MDRGWDVWPAARERAPRRPSEYLRRCWFDSVTWDRASLALLVERVGADHVVLGSDYPQLFAAIPLIGLFVLAFGWIEDVAAKRPPRLFPYPRKARGRRRAAG